MALAVAAILAAAAACSTNDNATPTSSPTVTEGTPTVPASPEGTPPPAGSPSATEVPASPASTPPATPSEEPLTSMQLEQVFSWYTPNEPTHMLQPPDGTGRTFISEQEGKLIVLTGDPDGADGTVHTALDITDKVSTQDREEGFLGFAFHPDFANNGRLFVYYSAADPRRSVISEFHVTGDDVDPDSERIIMEISQPFGNHNGGMLIFGPDGYMYISLGDGGGQGDPSGNGQDLTDLLASVLRIDVDAPGVPYGIPPDNPFADGRAPDGGEARPEVWAYGLRNPWRLAFDPVTHELWTADAGQNKIEEVDLLTPGGNYGWNLKEGPECYKPTTGCESQATTPLIEPVASYEHDQGCSVIGGYVYRGARLPSLYGAYIYGDYCSGILWGLRYSDGQLKEDKELADSDFLISAFGQPMDGEVYVLTYTSGIYRFVEE